MKRENVSRRDFNKLGVAAMGGLMAGSLVGCGGGEKTEKTDEKTGKTEADSTKKDADKADPLAAWGDKHVCKGLNACKGKGKGGGNECAGKGACFTANEHACHTANDCKYQGGCAGDFAKVASNDCKGMGDCGVPLSEGAYEAAYKKFKADMEKAGMADKLPAMPPGPPKS